MSRAEEITETAGEVHEAAPKAPLFERFDDADVRAVIETYPLAWVCAGSGAAIEASQLPLIGVYDEAGRLTELIGHLMRSNPLCPILARDPGAMILFAGPDAYVSPEHAGRRDWAPTWNYAQLRIGVDLVLDADLTEYSLKVLIDAMEGARQEPWDVGELGDRYRAMLGRIIGFRARVTSLSGKFKLGQDEDSGTLNEILANLPDAATAAWMRRFNKGR